MYDRSYKLAVFGDSYADCGPPNGMYHKESYYYLLKQILENSPPDQRQVHPDSQTPLYENLGVSGASSYWSYYNFKKYTVDLNYKIENAIMTFTDTTRLPITNPDLANASWKNVFRVDKTPLPISTEVNLKGDSPSRSFWDSVIKYLPSNDLPTVGSYNESDIFSMWNLLFEDNYASSDLVRLISVHSLTESIKIAKSRNINLVIMIPVFNSMQEYLGKDPDPDIINNFMIITGIDKVSNMETKTYSDDMAGTEFVKAMKEIKWKNSEFDTRCHHLCKTNNKVLADLIWQGLNGQKGIYDLSEQPGLNFNEIHNYADIVYND